MEKFRIIVIGASAGGFYAMKKLVADLPENLEAAILVVWHMASDVRGILPDVLNRSGKLHATNAVDNEQIIKGRIYVAPPDHHLLVDGDVVRLTKGPKENRFRPAVDPLFRSAAYRFRNRVIGVILSGALDDGSAGLWTVKNMGGIAMVQDPSEAEVPSMPENAIRAVEVDHILPVANIASQLVKLCAGPLQSVPRSPTIEITKLEKEIRIALIGPSASVKDTMELGEVSPYACPECHGVLTAIKEGRYTRFRCHTGHAYSADTLLASITEKIEDSLWGAIRGAEESILLLNHMGDHIAEANDPGLAATYFRKAQDAASTVAGLQEVLKRHERLSLDSIREEAIGTTSGT